MMNVQLVIATASEMIRKYGFVQGKLKSSDGFCIVGAIVAATNDEELRWLAVECVRKTCGWTLLSKWNDNPGRTKAEAIALLKRAMSRAREYPVPRRAFARKIDTRIAAVA